MTKTIIAEKNAKVASTAKKISYETLLVNKDENGRTMAQNMANKKAYFSMMEAATIISTMALQKVRSKNRWAVRTAESEDARLAYELTKEVATLVTFEKCPKGTIIVPCGTENSDIPNAAFIFKKRGGQLVIGFKNKPTYSLYRRLCKVGHIVDGLWYLGVGIDSARLEKMFGANTWAARYIKG